MDVLAMKTMQSWLMPRPTDANKGLFGRVLVLGGDFGMPGAVRIAAEGALRVGAGLVTVATRPEHVSSTVSTRPELLCYGLDADISGLDALIAHASVIVLGPGLGQSTWSQTIFNAVVQSSKPLLIDADGLNWLARTSPKTPRSNWILTPHPGEAARLLNTTVEQIQSDRMHAIQLLQQKWGGVIVLKGAGTLVATAIKPVQQCLDTLLAWNGSFECRTTWHPAWLTEAGLLDLAQGLAAQGVRKYAVQRSRSFTRSLPVAELSLLARTTLQGLFETFSYR